MKKKSLKKWLAMLLTAITVCSLAVPAAAGEVSEDSSATAAVDGEIIGDVQEDVSTESEAAGDVQEDAVTESEAAGDVQEDAAAESEAAGDAQEEAEAEVENTAAEENEAAVEGEITEDDVVEGEIAEDDVVEGEISVEAEDKAAPVGEIETDTGGVNADDNVVIEADDKPYLALGENLSKDQRAKVLSLMGIDAANLDNYNVVYITNQEEHQYLDEYLPAEKIGTRALSSVVIVKRGKGSGLNISTKNINYCTIGMYKNALATAGLKDADIIVAGPSPISGTAALIGAMKAYSEMTGEPVDEESLDAAMNEIVVTGELSDIIANADDGEVEEFIAYVKQKVLEGGLKDEGSIRKCIEEALKKYEFSMTDDEKNELVNVLLKISKLDIDVDSLLDQAKSLYDQIKHSEDAQGFFARIFQGIRDFFKNLFNW